MLEFNPKSVRKGKPIGLPYKGSKKKISKQIVQIIKENFGVDKPIYDIFGGGGAITAELLLQGLNVHYNDLDKSITDCFIRVLATDREHLKALIVSRDEFMIIKDKENKTADDELKLLVNSFGNNRSCYLYGAEHADMKFELAQEIVQKHNVFSGYKQTETYKQRLQQLEQLEVTNLSYEAFSNVEGAVFYLDPPYEGTSGYSKVKAKYPDKKQYQEIRNKLLSMPKGSEIVVDEMRCFLGNDANNSKRMYVKSLSNGFDSQAFYSWAFKMAKKNIVLISSYEISDDRFECVREFTTARSSMQGGIHKSSSKCERLFMVSWQADKYASKQISLF